MVHHGLYIVGQVPTGARAQESERGTELWPTRDFSFHAVILSVPSVWLSCSPEQEAQREYSARGRMNAGTLE
jgi:hypothetical protein